MKIYFLVILFLLFFVLALTIYFYYKERLAIYKDLKYICGTLSRNINFKKSPIDEILSSNSLKVSFLTKFVIKKHEIASRILGKENADFVCNFFDSMGQGDVGYELSNIDYYKAEFEQMEVVAKDDLQKKGLLYFKLIIGLGLMVCIILF